MKSYLVPTLLSLALIIYTTSCNNDDPEAPAVPIVSTTYENLNADAPTGRDDRGNPTGLTNQYTFFSFITNKVIPHSDSASTKWDIGFRGTSIIVNSGSSGPGSTKAQLVTAVYDTYTMAPEDGYKSDATAGSAIGTWSTYNPTTHVITATPGKIILIKTAEGRYAKMEILSYYKNSPSSPDAHRDSDRYYTFRYVYQPNESRSFSN